MRISSFSTSSLPMGVAGPTQWSGSLTTQAGPIARPGAMVRSGRVGSGGVRALISALSPSVSALDGYKTVGTGYRQGAVTHREAHALYGPRADVPGRQDARHARLQRTRLAVRPRPLAGSDDVGTGQEEALGVARDFSPPPRPRRFAPDSHQHAPTPH